MNRAILRRSNNIKKKEMRSVRAPPTFKTFYFSKDLVESCCDKELQLNLEHFYHPGKGRKTFFASCGNLLMEVIEYAEARRSWFFDNYICTNGRLYITIPIDTVFLAIPQLQKYCSQRAISLDNIYDEQDSSTMRLLNVFIDIKQLSCVADVKTAGDMTFFVYNSEKTMAWLSVKVKRLAQTLKNEGVYCGRSAVSQNYTKSENTSTELVNENEYLRMATDIVGCYIELELLEKLRSYLEIPEESFKQVEHKNGATKKRKSENKKSVNINEPKEQNKKKLKIDKGLTGTGLLDTSVEDDVNNKDYIPVDLKLPYKERLLTNKEKALAKSAKGTKSIASFFKKV